MGESVDKVFDNLTHGLGKLYGNEPSSPPEAEPAPDPDDQEAAREEQRRRQRRQNTGRLSTMLSQNSNLG